MVSPGANRSLPIVWAVGPDARVNDDPDVGESDTGGIIVLTESLQIGHKYFISLTIVRFWCEAVHSRMFGLHTDRISIANARGGRDLFDWYDSCESRSTSRTSSAVRSRSSNETSVCRALVSFAHDHRTPRHSRSARRRSRA